jgi:large subunit ribosomal protein L4e
VIFVKAKVYDLKGEAVEEIELPPVFESEYRPDIIKRAVLAIQSRRRQPYGTSPLAGIDYSAENWGPGHGYARVPRLKTGRRAAKVPQAVKGRAPHPPKVQKVWKEKINRKEMKKALCSAISATVDPALVSERPHIFDGELPKIVVDDFENLRKTKEVVEALKAVGVYGDVEYAKKRRRYRAGRGKMRGRRYVTKKSLLIVVGKNSDVLKATRNLEGVDVVEVRNLNVELLAPGAKPGRLTVWTKSAIDYLEGWLC